MCIFFSLVVTLLHFISAVIYAYVFTMFKHVLNEKANFKEIDKYIDVIIWSGIAISIIDLVTLPFAVARAIFDVGVLVFLVPFGILQVVLGVKLLNCKDDLFGYLKPLSYLAIATGVMVAGIVLILCGLIPSLASDVILALVFFRSAAFVRTQGSLNSQHA